MLNAALAALLVSVMLMATLVWAFLPPLAEAMDLGPLQSRDVPSWVVAALGGVILVAVLAIERVTLSGMPRERTLKVFGPFLLGVALSGGLPTAAFILYVLGLPGRTVTLAAAASATFLVAWTYRYRTFLEAPPPAEFSKRYTRVLALVAVAHLLLVTARAIARSHYPASPIDAAVGNYSHAFQVLVAMACLLAVRLRASCSVYASSCTATLSLWLALLFPFGTAAFVYWMARVREAEPSAPAA